MIHLPSFIINKVDLGSMLNSHDCITFSDFPFTSFYDVSTDMFILLISKILYILRTLTLCPEC